MRFALLLTSALIASADHLRDEDTLAAWEKLQAAEKESQKAVEAASQKAREAKTDAEKEAARVDWRAAYAKAEEAKAPHRKAFVEAFGKSDWGAWTEPVDGPMLEAGLNAVGAEAIEKDPALAVKAFETLVARLPEAPTAMWARTMWLPIALPATGELEKAEKRLGELAAGARDAEKPDLLMAVGDVRAIRGEHDGARSKYEEALKLIPEGVDPKNDARGRAKGNLELRLALVGKPAPEIDAKTWLGGEAKALSAHKGRVVLLEFWATW